MRSFVFPMSPAAEFPNDNPELHLGAIWTLSEPCGQIEAELHASTPAARESIPCPMSSGVQLIVAVDPPMREPESPNNDTPAKEPEPAKKQPPVQEPPAPIQDPPAKKPTIEEPPAKVPEVEEPEVETPRVPVDVAVEGFAILVRAMSRVATAAGVAIEEACIFDLFVVGKTPVANVPAAAVTGLVEAGYADESEGTLFTRDATMKTAAAWRAILRDEAADFAVCGSRMLDEWAADVVARIVGVPAKTEAFRRELRGHGVAAFGLLENAA
jgi:outer membrane biosynthesis protein TonB